VGGIFEVLIKLLGQADGAKKNYFGRRWLGVQESRLTNESFFFLISGALDLTWHGTGGRFLPKFSGSEVPLYTGQTWLKSFEASPHADGG